MKKNPANKLDELDQATEGIYNSCVGEIGVKDGELVLLKGNMALRIRPEQILEGAVWGLFYKVDGLGDDWWNFAKLVWDSYWRRLKLKERLKEEISRLKEECLQKGRVLNSVEKYHQRMFAENRKIYGGMLAEMIFESMVNKFFLRNNLSFRAEKALPEDNIKKGVDFWLLVGEDKTRYPIQITNSNRQRKDKIKKGHQVSRQREIEILPRVILIDKKTVTRAVQKWGNSPNILLTTPDDFVAPGTVRRILREVAQILPNNEKCILQKAINDYFQKLRQGKKRRKKKIKKRSKK